MNFQLAKEIYGLTPWLMDVHSIPVMTTILNNIKNGISLEIPEVKLNTPYLYDLSNETKIITRPYGNSWYPGELDNNDSFEGIAVIELNGPITLSGGASSVGMETISEMMYKMVSDSRVKAFIISANSGGGSSSAVEVMVDTINEVKKQKPVYSHLPKGAMSASACYGIISASDYIFSASEMNIVGSVGTMIQFEGKEANSTSPDGTKNIRLYATKSTAKNKGFEEALNNDNYKIIVNDLLDPVNENFIATVLSNRPSLSGIEFDNGSTYFSKDVVGTMIDGIKSFSEVVEMIESGEGFKTNNALKKTNTNTNFNTNTKMTKAEFKTANPTAYAEVVAEGVAQERDRTGAWMAHNETDPTEVRNGIESGEQITATQREAFFVKQNAKKGVAAMKSESAEDLNTPESKTAEEAKKEANKKELDSSFDFWNEKK